MRVVHSAPAFLQLHHDLWRQMVTSFVSTNAPRQPAHRLRTCVPVLQRQDAITSSRVHLSSWMAAKILDVIVRLRCLDADSFFCSRSSCLTASILFTGQLDSGLALGDCLVWLRFPSERQHCSFSAKESQRDQPTPKRQRGFGNNRSRRRTEIEVVQNQPQIG